MTCQKHPIWPGRLNDKPHKRSTGKTAPMQLNCLIILNIIKLLRTKLMVVPTQTTVFPIIPQRLLSKDNSNASPTVGAAFTSQVWSCNKDCIYVPWRRHAQEMCVCVCQADTKLRQSESFGLLRRINGPILALWHISLRNTKSALPKGWLKPVKTWDSLFKLSQKHIWHISGGRD